MSRKYSESGSRNLRTRDGVAGTKSVEAIVIYVVMCMMPPLGSRRLENNERARERDFLNSSSGYKDRSYMGGGMGKRNSGKTRWHSSGGGEEGGRWRTKK